MFRAVLEGLAFEARAIADAMVTVAGLPRFHKILTLGGSLKSDGDLSANGTGPHAWQPRSLADVERDFLQEALQQHNWETAAAARAIGLTPAALSKKIKAHQLQK